jgi:multicomponent Na+:H+ antiporter subunit G
VDEFLDVLGGMCMIVGASFALLAGIGVHKFRDTYSRMHAAAKSPTLGLVLVTIGAGLQIRTFAALATLTLVAILQLLTSPVATHLAARAVHLRVDVPQDGADELERDEGSERPIP